MDKWFFVNLTSRNILLYFKQSSFKVESRVSFVRLSKSFINLLLPQALWRCTSENLNIFWLKRVFPWYFSVFCFYFDKQINKKKLWYIYAYISQSFYITYVKRSENNVFNKAIIINKDQAIYPWICNSINVLVE